MKIKPCKIIFGICLFILVGINCMKAVSIDLIKEAFIGSAFSVRINDVISEASPEMNINDAIDLQELMEDHSGLDKVIHQYLCAYGKYLNGNHQVFDTLNIEKHFQKMNEDILKETKKRTPEKALTISDQEFLAKVRLAEDEVMEILQDTRLLNNLQYFGELAIFAINLYSLTTSIGIQSIILLIMLFLIIKICRLSGSDFKESYLVFGRLLSAHGVFWIVVYVLAKLADWRLLSVVDRFLGRSKFIEGTPFLKSGAGLLILGIMFIIFSRVKKDVLVEKNNAES